jgi:hypothetical protein
MLRIAVTVECQTRGGENMAGGIELNPRWSEDVSELQLSIVTHSLQASSWLCSGTFSKAGSQRARWHCIQTHQPGEQLRTTITVTTPFGMVILCPRSGDKIFA